ncbi:MAG: exosome complex protein Rrp42 [Candidatus Bathyarchaeota archaeon]|jgi:exosome complex component RRP42|nr:exosome complex protein Rrp42 [Candidatus Bathyarchaeota archaeon]
MSATPKTSGMAKLERDAVLELASKNRRLDGRALTDYRKIKIETGIIEKANGSAQVTLGKTKVMVGVKVQMGSPFPDTPNEGVQTVNVELTPLAYPTFETGPPGENAIELARIVDRNLRESKAIDVTKLCITPGNKVFVVFVDINVLDHDGNLIDASTYAALAALMTGKFPEYELKDGEVIFKDSFQPLPINNHPVPVTFAKVGKILVADPCLKEEEAMSARLTVGIDKDDFVCAMQKGGIGELDSNEIKAAVETAINKSRELRGIIMEASK